MHHHQAESGTEKGKGSREGDGVARRPGVRSEGKPISVAVKIVDFADR